MDWEKAMKQIREAYKNASDENKPISKDNYLNLLSAFEKLASSSCHISDMIDLDFRRNLPGASLSGLEPVSLDQRIKNAHTFATNHPVYPLAGQCLVENILALLRLNPNNATNANIALDAVQPTIQNILDGNL